MYTDFFDISDVKSSHNKPAYKCNRLLNALALLYLVGTSEKLLRKSVAIISYLSIRALKGP